MNTLRSKAFVSIAIVFCLFLAYFATQPLPSERLHSYLDKVHSGAEKDQNSSSSSPLEHESVQYEIIAPSSSTATFSTTLHTSASASAGATPPAVNYADPVKIDKILVVASTREADVNWIFQDLPDWRTAIYTADDPTAMFHPAQNKGNEANVYLTYIIDNYDSLPSVMIFVHGHQKHKHGTRDRIFEGLDYDNLEAIRNFDLTFVQKTGYANLRCMEKPGCPSEIQPFRPEEDRPKLRPQEAAMADAWTELFGNSTTGTAVPRVIASPCCAQFAVSREQVLKRSKEEYERYLRWIYETSLDDFTSGRVFEYLWHVIFGKDPVYCPEEKQCYRDQYGTTPPPRHKNNGKPKEKHSRHARHI